MVIREILPVLFVGMKLSVEVAGEGLACNFVVVEPLIGVINNLAITVLHEVLVVKVLPWLNHVMSVIQAQVLRIIDIVVKKLAGIVF